MKKYIILILLLVLAVIGYNYIYQDHRDIEHETPEFSLSAEKLQSDFLMNYSQAETLYLDKTLHVKGKVTELNASDLTLDDIVFCSFKTIDNVKIGDVLMLKGRCIGYDDLLEIVKMDQCTIIEN